MKKTVIIACILLHTFGTKIQAQDVEDANERPDYHRVEFGLRFMPTFSAFDMETSGGGAIQGEATLGYGIGGLLAFNFTNHLGLQGEVIYNSLSQKYRDNNLDRRINVRYINIPLLLSLNTGKSRPVNLNIVGGPQFGFNIGSSISSSGTSETDTVTYVLATKKSDFGFAYGAGLEFALNEARTIRMDVGFRGVYGFVDIGSNNESGNNNSVSILDRAKVRTYSGYLGIAFLF